MRDNEDLVLNVLDLRLLERRDAVKEHLKNVEDKAYEINVRQSIVITPRGI